MNDELWSLDDSKKTPDEIYFGELSTEGFRVMEVLAILLDDKKISDNTIIQIGAQSNWLWIDKFKKLDSFKLFAEREFNKAKS